MSFLANEEGLSLVPFLIELEKVSVCFTESLLVSLKVLFVCFTESLFVSLKVIFVCFTDFVLISLFLFFLHHFNPLVFFFVFLDISV